MTAAEPTDEGYPIEGVEVVDLSDSEAQFVAWALGIHVWIDRGDLNRQLREVMP